MWSWNGALPGRGWKSKTTTRVISTTDHCRAVKTRSTNRSKGGWNGITQSGSYSELPSAVSWQRLLPQSRWFEGRHITLPVPGDFHSAGGDIPQPHTASEQTEEELAGDTGSEHHLQPPRAFCSPETLSHSHSPRRRAGLHQPQPLVTPKVSFWETAGLVPGCLT